MLLAPISKNGRMWDMKAQARAAPGWEDGIVPKRKGKGRR